METLDLHGIRHHQVERIVENFLLLNALPLRIITGNSQSMRRIVSTVIENCGLQSQFETDWNLGSLIVTE